MSTTTAVRLPRRCSRSRRRRRPRSESGPPGRADHLERHTCLLCQPLQCLAMRRVGRNDDTSRRFAEEGAESGPVALVTGAPGTSTVQPIPPVSKVHSASVTATPPSAQSCADSINRRPAASTSSLMSARSRSRSSAGACPATMPWTLFRYSLPSGGRRRRQAGRRRAPRCGTRGRAQPTHLL